MAIVESLTLDGLVLNDATFGLASLDLTPPNQRADWVGSADSEYAALFRDPLYENRTIVAKLNIAPQATMDLALGFVGSVRDKLAEASKTQDGIDLVWTPSNGTTSVTFDVLAGEISDLPIDWENGWLVAAPTITVTMTAKPYWRKSTETTITAVASGTAPQTTVAIPTVGGDVPALGRLIVTNTGTTAVRWLEWGLEQRGYNAASPDSLVLDSDGLVTSGFAGTQTTRAGAYDPGAAGNSVIRVTAPTSTTSVCGTGTLDHVGRFKVAARVYVDATTTRMRFTWRSGDGGYISNAWATPVVAGVFSRIDLGVIDLPAAVVGTQAWDGRIELYDTSGATNTADVDFLQLIPTDSGYGRSKALASSAAASLIAFDSFTGTTAAAALATRTPTIGAAWATSGAATDFAFEDVITSVRAPWTTTEHLVRSVASATRRYAVFGASLTDQQMTAEVQCAAAVVSGDTFPWGDMAIIVRWTDASNYLRFGLDGPTNQFRLVKVVAGVETVLAAGPTLTYTGGSPPVVVGGMVYTVTVRASGLVSAVAMGAASSTVAAGQVLYSAQVTDTALATAGTLASGKGGLVDSGNGTAVIARRYANPQVAIPAAESVVAYGSRGYQARYDDTYREATGGGTWGRESSYRGSRFLIAPAGTDARTSRVVVHATTAELESAAMDTVTAAYTVGVAYTERGLVVPR